MMIYDDVHEVPRLSAKTAQQQKARFAGPSVLYHETKYSEFLKVMHVIVAWQACDIWHGNQVGGVSGSPSIIFIK